ncbi:MAG: hypothetical protein LBJ12_06245 [Oscillospiraceae bacterium]|jgi:hypothetical protein|nr:hypothetical protein [Oscillospiraceae bacterium]
METKTGMITEDELDAINKYTRHTLTADDVYTFSVVLCDNEIDRDLERFDSDALPVLAEMFVGKTGIFDHHPSAQNQRARIFAAECVPDSARKTQTGEDYLCIKAKAYIPRTEANAALIEEIESGIKKEVSVGCAMGRVVCSVCGAELRGGACEHKRGRSYNGKLCHAVLREPTDAYEWSFVAVPAQPLAGVRKGALNCAEDVSPVSVRKLLGEDTDPNGTEDGIGGLSDAEREEAIQIRASVREETLRLALMALPSLDNNTARALCAQLSFKQCRDFIGALREKQTLAKPKTPQLATPRGDSGDKQNAAFRI